jgi:hypothetical protein
VEIPKSLELLICVREGSRRLGRATHKIAIGDSDLNVCIGLLCGLKSSDIS